MKKVGLVSLILSLLAPAVNAAELRWADVYKAGPLKLVHDPSFGKGVDWGSILFESNKEIAVADDGSIFVVNSRDHNIHKFDPSGKKVITFGRRGQGPGDFEFPSKPSILDGKYLVVGEYALNRRISLFDMNGRFYKLLKTQGYVYGLVALTGTKIAYLSQQPVGQEPSRMEPGFKQLPMTVRVVIKDIETGAENVLLTRNFSRVLFTTKTNITFAFGSDFAGSVSIARAAGGNLAVGVSESPRVEIYDGLGKRLSSFAVKTPARPVTAEYVALYKKALVDTLKKDGEKSAHIRDSLVEIENSDVSAMFEKMIPYYSDMLSDADGNLLFVDKTDKPGQPVYSFLAYSPQGEMIAETRLDAEAFDFKFRFNRLCFSKAGLFGLGFLKGDEDELPVLFRVVPGAGKLSGSSPWEIADISDILGA
jgi:hypothetical protein